MCLQMHKQAAEQQAQQQQADDADKAYVAMEELLGKAAAKAWKAARDASTGTAAANTLDPAAAISARSAASSASASRTNSNKQLEVTGAAAQPQHLDSFGRSISISSTNSSSSFGDNGNATAAADNAASSAGPSGALTPRTAAATAAAAGLLAAAASAANPAESLKLQLAALGVQDPANVSRRLLEEVGQRADLDWLLSSVAACLEAKGMPRRLSKKSSMKITRELNKR
jgi:hypothetical protein